LSLVWFPTKTTKIGCPADTSGESRSCTSRIATVRMKNLNKYRQTGAYFWDDLHLWFSGGKLRRGRVNRDLVRKQSPISRTHGIPKYE